MGILALQGDIEKHARIIEKAGAQSIPVKTKARLEQVDGLIIPGGESTTIGKLLVRFSLMEALKVKIHNGLPVFGTCAGTILLAKEIKAGNQVKLGIMNITVSRNAYGPQIESFETDIILSLYKDTTEQFRAVFIRAPIITRIGKKCEVLALFENRPVLVREKNILTATFHPELTDDMRIHRYFLEMVG
ncbi:MAG: pyridoxal 5'-phosphate synthase glutaminase subunit PdxT [Spirochaetales bacterium]|nr:pyridoxal 5'-phosphate synthase glutaminase subunit PdxT [Spirochaetales bacterium]